MQWEMSRIGNKGMDEVIRSVLVDRRLLSGGSDHLARLWRFILAFTPYALFLYETVGVTLNACAEPAYLVHTMGMINLANYFMSRWYLCCSLY